MPRVLYMTLLAWVLMLSACHQEAPQKVEKTTLTIYSGITMVNPLRVLAREFEAAHPSVEIKIIQGASGFLWQDILQERQGDIYFPGSETYRKNNQHPGVLQDYIFVGYNRVALIVPKGNPKHLTHEIAQLTDPELSVVLSAPTAGSIGKATKKILDKIQLTDQVYQNVTYFTTDSHRLNQAILSQEADVAVNWYATAMWPDSKNETDAILLPENIAPVSRLELNLLSFSKHPELAKQFIRACGSEKGLRTFAQYGFLTEPELHNALAALKETHEK